MSQADSVNVGAILVSQGLVNIGQFTGLAVGPGMRVAAQGNNAFLDVSPPDGFLPDVADLAALTASDDATALDNAQRRVITLLAAFTLDKGSTATIDGITVVATNSGVGRWLRVPGPVPEWTARTVWGVDLTGAGNDQNSGEDTPGNRLATIAEVSRRLAAINLRTYTIRLTGATIPITEDVIFSPEILPNDSSGEFDAAIVIEGDRVPFFTSAVTAATSVVGNVQASITDATAPWAASVGKLIVVTSGAVVGAVAHILKDLGAGVARVSQWQNTATGSVAAPAPGDTYQIVDRTLCNAVIRNASLSATPSYTFKDIEFTTALNFGTAHVNLVTTRHTGISGPDGSLFLLPEGNLDANTICVQFSAVGGIGVAETYSAFFGSSFINCDVTPNAGAIVNFVDCVAQGCRRILVGFKGGSYTGLAGQLTITGTYGLGVFDTQTAQNAVGVRRGGQLAIGSGGLYGSGAVVGSLFGLAVFEGGRVFIRSTVTPTITNTAGELQLEGAATALQGLELSSGGVFPTLVPLATWANWTAAVVLNVSGFARNVVSYKTGAAISNTVGV